MKIIKAFSFILMRLPAQTISSKKSASEIWSQLTRNLFFQKSKKTLETTQVFYLIKNLNVSLFRCSLFYANVVRCSMLMWCFSQTPVVDFIQKSFLCFSPPQADGYFKSSQLWKKFLKEVNKINFFQRIIKWT